MELNPLDRFVRLPTPSSDKDSIPTLADIEPEDEDDANGGTKAIY